MVNSKIKVLYIAGFERSGSTILNRVLGQTEGFVAWGELRDVWQHGIVENRRCTCGELFADCPAWQDIFKTAFTSQDNLDIAEIIELQKKTRSMVLPHYFGLLKNESFQLQVKPYLTKLERLYQAIQSTTNSKVIVDSTKASWYGYILGLLPSIDLYVIHIVRNPQGICYSLESRKKAGEPECQWYNPLHASLSWDAKNYAVEMLLQKPQDRYLRICYEDFVRNPQETTQAILNLIKEENVQLPFESDSTVKMGIDHLFTGSPSSRSKTGSVELKLDERWQNNLKLIDKITINGLTLPLIKKYGY